MSSAKAAAADYRRTGWSPIPVKARSKATSLSRLAPYLERRATAEELESWSWSGVGIVTGPLSGVLVLDVDGPEGQAELQKRHHPVTPMVRTARGGLHLYFKHPEQPVRTGIRVAPGLDVKASGGYVVAPPSIGANGRPYEWIVSADDAELADPPDWLMELIERERPKGPAGPVGERIPSGQRNKGLASLAGTMRRRGMGEAEILAALRVANEQRCSPPLEADEVEKIAASVARYEPAENVVHISANGHGSGRPEAPEIRINNRHLRDVTADTLAALEASNNPPEVFVRAGALVRVREDEHGTPQIQNMDLNHVRGRADRSADFLRVTKQGDNWIKTRVNPPEVVIKDLMALPSWPFPALEAVVESPILRPDGSVFGAPGYDAKTRLYYRPVPGFRHPEIPAAPGKGELRAALELLNEAIGEFPYADKSSAANILGLLVTLLIRQAIPGPVPLALVDAPQAGTGKTLLAEIVAIIGTGRAGEMLGAPRDDEEWRKQITSKLSAGGTLIVVDNVENALYAPSLARALTSRTWTDRVLGRSEMVTVSQRATWIATGNNISLRGDLPRRCYWIRLDAKDSRPWKREQFKHPDLTSWVERNRGELVGAVLTIARGWYAADKPKAEGIPRLGSFEAWTEIVGGILAFAGIEGFLANLEELYSKADEGNAEWEAFLEEWWRQRGEDPITVKDLSKLIDDEKTLGDALPGDLSEARDKGEGSFTRRLGKAIAKRAGTRYGEDGLHITEAGEVRRAKLWSVQDSSDEGEFVSFVSLYNPSASKNVCNETIQAGNIRPNTVSGGPETNSPNSQTHIQEGVQKVGDFEDCPHGVMGGCEECR